jgi:hypothetical protein
MLAYIPSSAEWRARVGTVFVRDVGQTTLAFVLGAQCVEREVERRDVLRRGPHVEGCPLGAMSQSVVVGDSYAQFGLPATGLVEGVAQRVDFEVPAAPAARSAHLLVIPAGHPGGVTEVAASGAWRESGPALSRRSRRAVPSLWWRRTACGRIVATAKGVPMREHWQVAGPSVTVADGPRGSSCSTASTCCSRFVNSAGSTGIACRRVCVRPRAGRAPRQPAGWSAVACAKKRQIASVASGPRGSV